MAKLAEAAPNRKAGYVDAVMSVAAVVSDTHISVSYDDFDDLREKFSLTPLGGAGSELKKLLKLIGITASPTCQCNQRAKVMDERGCDWCEENIETICEWLKEESQKRGLLFVKSAVKLLVRRAISNARAVASKE